MISTAYILLISELASSANLRRSRCYNCICGVPKFTCLQITSWHAGHPATWVDWGHLARPFPPLNQKKSHTGSVPPYSQELGGKRAHTLHTRRPMYTPVTLGNIAPLFCVPPASFGHRVRSSCLSSGKKSPQASHHKTKETISTEHTKSGVERFERQLRSNQWGRPNPVPSPCLAAPKNPMISKIICSV